MTNKTQSDKLEIVIATCGNMNIVLRGFLGGNQGPRKSLISRWQLIVAACIVLIFIIMYFDIFPERVYLSVASLVSIAPEMLPVTQPNFNKHLQRKQFLMWCFYSLHCFVIIHFHTIAIAEIFAYFLCLSL